MAGDQLGLFPSEPKRRVRKKRKASGARDGVQTAPEAPEAPKARKVRKKRKAKPPPTLDAPRGPDGRTLCPECGSDDVRILKVFSKADAPKVLITYRRCGECYARWSEDRVRSDCCDHGIMMALPCSECGRGHLGEDRG